MNNCYKFVIHVAEGSVKNLVTYVPSEYEIMVGIPASLSASSQDRLEQMIDNALLVDPLQLTL